jgi:hypothetical protein
MCPSKSSNAPTVPGHCTAGLTAHRRNGGFFYILVYTYTIRLPLSIGVLQFWLPHSQVDYKVQLQSSGDLMTASIFAEVSNLWQIPRQDGKFRREDRP